MKLLWGILMPILLLACSFKPVEETQKQTANPLVMEVEDQSLDSDGDGVNNAEERSLGRNPNLADLPELKLRFLQNYKVDISYSDLTATPSVSASASIDTKVGASDPDFKYRVGRIFVRDNAYKSAASIGRFSSHSVGSIEERDYTWVKYPDLDPRFFHKKSLELIRAFDKEKSKDQSVKLTLENSIQLLANRNFDSISNLEVSFYFYDYEKESYELVGTKKIERHFSAGVTETFEVELENVPLKLIEDNFFKKGEFIISEVTDYEIPSLKTTYKQLLKSIREKTIPIAINTPLESRVFYVATSERGKRFSELMSVIFDKGFKVEEDRLIKVGQFENNLPEFTYLKEVSDKDKLGKWFVFSNELRSSFLDHAFKVGDYLGLSFITGAELASQSDEKIFSRKENLASGEEFEIIPIGNVTPNSRINIEIRGVNTNGDVLKRSQELIDTQDASCGRNCISLGKYCRWDIVRPESFSRPMEFKEDFSGDIEQVSLILNEKEYTLKDLYKEENGTRKISLKFDKDHLHIEILDMTKIFPINSFDENLLSLKIKTNSGRSFYGIKLSEVGRTWDGVGGCPFLTPGMSLDKGLPIASESLYLDKIKLVHQNAIRPDLRDRISYSKEKSFLKPITVSISSSVNNFFN